jgi:protein required for attachment to host cells
MKRACIAIVDAARARIYTYDEPAYADRAGSAPGTMLREEIDLVNPGRRGHDLFSTTKPGIKRPVSGGGTTDDHRAAHFEQLEHRFAKQVIEEVDRVARRGGFAHVVFVATPKMLGELRTLDAVLRRADLTFEYIERDLTRLTSPQIHDHLAQLRLIAPRPRPALAVR